MQLEAAHTVEIAKLVEYIDRKEDPLGKGRGCTDNCYVTSMKGGEF
jgi:hypothetical protein